MPVNGGINKIILLGIISNQPYPDTIDQESCLCFQLTTQQSVKRNDSIDKYAELHSIKLPVQLALRDRIIIKGDIVYIQGKIITVQFVDELQVRRSKTEILANFVQIITPDTCAKQ